MQLFYSHASPYARKCRILLHLTGLIEKTELILVNPLDNAEYRNTNPLGKVPALTNGETTIFDSPLICEYIDSLAENSKKQDLFCKQNENYFLIQLAHAQANGILDAAVSTVMELRRETEHSQYWLERWLQSIKGAIETFNIDNLGNRENTHIATVAAATALAYLDFRLPDIPWRDWNQQLATWFDLVKDENWFVETQPK